MNLSALTAKEVMRICHPETELERRLFDIVGEIQSELDDVIEDRKLVSLHLEDSISSDDWDDLVRAVRSAIENISSGKIDDAKKILESAI